MKKSPCILYYFSKFCHQGLALFWRDFRHGNCESVQTGAFGGVPRPNGACALGRCATLGRRTVVKSGTQALAGFNAHNVFHLQAVS